MSKAKNNKKTIIHLRSTDELKSKLIDLALLDNVKMSEVISNLINEEHRKKIHVENGVKTINLEL